MEEQSVHEELQRLRAALSEERRLREIAESSLREHEVQSMRLMEAQLMGEDSKPVLSAKPANRESTVKNSPPASLPGMMGNDERMLLTPAAKPPFDASQLQKAVPPPSFGQPLGPQTKGDLISRSSRHGAPTFSSHPNACQSTPMDTDELDLCELSAEDAFDLAADCFDVTGIEDWHPDLANHPGQQPDLTSHPESPPVNAFSCLELGGRASLERLPHPGQSPSLSARQGEDMFLSRADEELGGMQQVALGMGGLGIRRVQSMDAIAAFSSSDSPSNEGNESMGMMPKHRNASMDSLNSLDTAESSGCDEDDILDSDSPSLKSRSTRTQRNRNPTAKARSLKGGRIQKRQSNMGARVRSCDDLSSVAEEAELDYMEYECCYCSARKVSMSAGGDGRVRIRCECGGKHQDRKPRMHAKWVPVPGGETQSELRRRIRAQGLQSRGLSDSAAAAAADLASAATGPSLSCSSGGNESLASPVAHDDLQLTSDVKMELAPAESGANAANPAAAAAISAI